MKSVVDEKSKQFAREAAIGLSFISVLVTIAFVVGYFRVYKTNKPDLPIPVATEVPARNVWGEQRLAKESKQKASSKQDDAFRLPASIANSNPTSGNDSSPRSLVPSSNGTIASPVSLKQFGTEDKEPNQVNSKGTVTWPGVSRLAQQEPKPSPYVKPSLLPPKNAKTESANTVPAGYVEVKLKGNDSWWTIAERTYGNGQYFRALSRFAEENGIVIEKLGTGTPIQIPDVNKIEQLYADETRIAHESGTVIKSSWKSMATPEQGSGRTYVTNGTESLFEIARQQLGQGARYTEILELNRLDLPQHVDATTPLPKNLTLNLP